MISLTGVCVCVDKRSDFSLSLLCLTSCRC
jgi:hypothetical protein